MKKFDRVNQMVQEHTKGNYMLSTRVDARHNGKYVLMGTSTMNTSWQSYKTLNEVIAAIESDQINW